MYRKKSNIKYDWSDILSENGGVQSLVALRQNVVVNHGGTLEITLNYPRTAAFNNASSDKQKVLYTKAWNEIRNTCGLDIKESGFTFEFCKSGHVHLHGYIDYNDDKPLIPIGLVSDMAKAYLNKLPRKYSAYKPACMFSEYTRYRCPSITVQYVYADDVKRKAEWRAYIKKCVQN